LFNYLIYFFIIEKIINIRIYILVFIKYIYIKIGDWGLGIGDWGLGIGDWAQSPIPNL
jgi:hypothetical protein